MQRIGGRELEPIDEVVRKMTGGRKIEQDAEALLEKMLRLPRIHSFASAHAQIKRGNWLRNLSNLYQFAEDWEHCDHCPGLAHCPNMMKGFQPHLFEHKGAPSLTYAPCPLLRQEEQRRRQAALIHSYYVPKDVLKATFKTIDKRDPERAEAIAAAVDFVRDYLDRPQETKGLYLCGEFGVGKTYVMGAIMNRLAELRQIASLIVYVPDFFREIRGAIQEHTVDQKLDVLKQAPVLILDDIGAETMTPWIRDEVLGSILQYRMMERLPTLYTSNFNYEELEDHFSYSQKSGTEDVKAKRLMERIRHYTRLVKMGGRNRR